MTTENKKKILIVDDEHDILDVMEAIIRQAGYKVFTASNGKDGVEIAKKEIPDLIVLDIMMPGMDGSATTDVLKNYRSTRDIPIIYLSCLVKERDLEADGHIVGSRVGNVYFVPKTASADEILEIIKKNIDSPHCLREQNDEKGAGS